MSGQTSLDLQPITAHTGAVIDGIDLSAPLTDQPRTPHRATVLGDHPTGAGNLRSRLIAGESLSPVGRSVVIRISSSGTHAPVCLRLPGVPAAQVRTRSASTGVRATEVTRGCRATPEHSRLAVWVRGQRPGPVRV